MLSELTDRFIDNSIERLEGLDEIIDNIYNEKGNRGEYFRKFLQEIHSLKGSAGTFGFHLVSTIAHRLEDYMESSRRLEQSQWLDVQKFIDAIKVIFEDGKDPEQDTYADVLSKLPNSSVNEDRKKPLRTLLLIMSSGVVRKHLGVELAAKGFDISFAKDPIEALDIALKIHPDVIVSNQEFENITGQEFYKITKQVNNLKNIPFVLMTANEKLVSKLENDSSEPNTIHMDKSTAENIIRFF